MTDRTVLDSFGLKAHLDPVLYRDATADFQGKGAMDTPKRQLSFAKRLILSAGLLAAARHVLRRTEERWRPSEEDARLDRQIVALLTGSYGLGLATSIVARSIGTRVQAADGDRMPVDPLGAVLWLDQLNVGNFRRALAEVGLEGLPGHVLKAVEPLIDGFSFDGAIRLRGKIVDTAPFVRVAEGHLYGLREIAWEHDGEGRRVRPAVIYEAYAESMVIKAVDTVPDSGAARQITSLLTALGEPDVRKQDPVHVEHQSFVEIFFSSHRQFDDLTQLLIDKATDETKLKWLQQYLRIHDATAYLKQTEILRTAILAECLEQDPISALTSFFCREPDDVEVFIRRFRPSESEQIFKTMRSKVDTVVARSRAFGGAADEIALETRERARLGAIEVAVGLGFPVKQTPIRSSGEECLAVLSEFIRTMETRWDQERMLAALIETAKMSEEALRFAVEFHRLVAAYDASQAGGVSRSYSSARGRPPALGTLIDEFRRICKTLGDESAAPAALGCRRGLAKTAEPHLQALTKFLEWRNDECHPRQEVLNLPPEKQIERLRGVEQFFRFIEGTVAGRGAVTRLMPAVLHLSVVTSNRCGITSVTYTLNRSSSKIRLFTRQPVAAAAGVFYGLACAERSNSYLWIDPVLFSAEAFEKAAGVA